MSEPTFALLPDRGVVSAKGPDARAFLDNIVTNDVDLLDRQPAIHAALLTPQGKILFEFHLISVPDGFLLETGASQTAALIKRLTLYKLRAKVEIDDISPEVVVAVSWPDAAAVPETQAVYPDARHPGLGYRMILPAGAAENLTARNAGTDAWNTHRIALGVPEAGQDYELGDTFPHEADFDLLAGVSFTKGCFVGQEVVARMQHKSVVRKRIVRIAANAPLRDGAEVKAGEATIGRVGSTAGNDALAMLRLDRVHEAGEKAQPLTAGGVPITVDPEAVGRYVAAKEARNG